MDELACKARKEGREGHNMNVNLHRCSISKEITKNLEEKKSQQN